MYNNDDKAWTINPKTLKIEEVTIQYIYVTTLSKEPVAKYEVGFEHYVEESMLFPTKEDLIEYIGG